LGHIDAVFALLRALAGHGPGEGGGLLGPAGISGRYRADPEAGAATAKTGQGHRAAGRTGRDSLCLRVLRQKLQAACRSSRRTRAVSP
jgi:hypothetical protein